MKIFDVMKGRRVQCREHSRKLGEYNELTFINTLYLHSFLTHNGITAGVKS